MKRSILFICLLVVLSACAYKDDEQSALKSALSIEIDKINVRENNSLTFYSYYVPSDMAVLDQKGNIAIMEYDGDKIVMNLNIASIINKEYYEENKLNDDGFFDDDKLIYEHEGKYLSSHDHLIDYFFKAYGYDGQYLLHLMSENINMYASCDIYNLKPVAEKMLFVAKTIDVDEDDVVSEYSSKEVIDYQKKQVNLFDLVVPENGKLEELLLDK